MASKIPLSFYLECVDIYVIFSLKGKQFRRKEAPVCVEEDNCEESPEKGFLRAMRRVTRKQR